MRQAVSIGSNVATQKHGSAKLRLHTLSAAILAALLAIVFVASLRGWPDTLFNLDFISFWTGASLLREGAGPALFDVERQRLFQVDLRSELAMTDEMRRASGYNPYHNPPPLALVFVPLTLLPLSWGYIVWSAISLLTMLAAVSLPLRGHPQAPRLAFLAMVFGGVAGTLLEGQVNGLFLFAFSLALLALTHGRPVCGGALLGLLWLKPQYAAPFALVFLLKGRWRELIGVMGMGIVLGALSLLMVGTAGLDEYFAELRQIGAFRPPPSAMVSPHAMVNWRAVLLNLWPSIPDDLGNTLVVLLGGATVVTALIVWRGEWSPASPRFPRQMLVLSLATIVASPHSHFHGSVLLLAPLALMLRKFSFESDREQAWLALLMSGQMLSVLLWMLVSLHWLMVLYFLLVMALLIYHTAQPRFLSPKEDREG